MPILLLPMPASPPCLNPNAQVGVEKEKVNAENAAAQVEADSCATIAREVTKLQARCEVELAAAEPLVAQAQEALDTLTKKDLGECPLPSLCSCSFGLAWAAPSCQPHVLLSLRLCTWEERSTPLFIVSLLSGAATASHSQMAPDVLHMQASSRRCATRQLAWTTSQQSCCACWRMCRGTRAGGRHVSGSLGSLPGSSR